MNAFHKRLMPGVEAEKQAVDIINSISGVDAVALNGTEHTHPEFVDKLRRNNSDQSMFVRYAPDGVMLKCGKVVHFDVKAAKTIEKNAYNTYMRYKLAGCSVVLIVKHNNDWFIQRIDKLRLIDGRTSVAGFPNPFPVDEDGWICPRNSGRQLSGAMSGTPYRYIDMESMMPWRSPVNAKKDLQ